MIDLTTYDGGKGLVFRNIVNEIPPHDIFISGFAGGCAVARHKEPAKLNILVDRDERVVEAWVSMLVGNDEAAAASELTRSDDLVKDDEVVEWILVHGSFLDVLPHLPLTRRTVLYLDPPYLVTTRSYQKRPLYRHEFSTTGEHEALLLAVMDLDCRVLISGYQSELYGRLLSDWRRVDYWTTNRAGTRVLESLWCNFDEPVWLHDYRWLGDGWRERDRIKQKTKRWVNRFDNLPVLERRFILQALAARGLLD